MILQRFLALVLATLILVEIFWFANLAAKWLWAAHLARTEHGMYYIVSNIPQVGALAFTFLFLGASVTIRLSWGRKKLRS